MNNGFVQRGGWWVVGQFLLLLAIAGLDLTGQATTKPLPFFISGLILIVAATICSLAGLLALGRNLTPFPKPSAKTELVQHGVYALIRHPLYTSVFCAAVGSSFIFQSWRPWLFPWGWVFSLMPKPGTKNVGCGSNSQNTRAMSGACGDSFRGFTNSLFQAICEYNVHCRESTPAASDREIAKPATEILFNHIVQFKASSLQINSAPSLVAV